MLRFAAILTLCSPAFTGCEKRVSAENIETVNRQQQSAQKRPGRVESVAEGLTMKEVESVLGTPANVTTGKVSREVRKDFVLTTWTYQQDGKSVELSFIDGKLQGALPHFGASGEERAPLEMKSTGGAK